MRILLVNNASGVHEYLRRGLEELGHEVVLALGGTGNYQSRAADAHFGVVGTTFRARARRVFEPLAKLRALGRFDVANYQSGLTLFGSPLTRYMDLRVLKLSGTRLSYYGLGCDEASLLRIRPDIDELPCAECIAYDANGKSCARLRLDRRPRAGRGARLMDFAVSAAYIYDHGLDFFPNAAKDKIQFPIDISGLNFAPAVAKDRPLIVHSPTKMGFKGSRHILEAMRLLGERRDDFEFKLVRGLSHADYLRTMKDCDIYLDQIFSADSFGIAALENMACGKVVVSGNGPLGWGSFPFMREAPVVRAAMAPQVLADILSDLLDRKADYPGIGQMGRDYVRSHHDHVAVAERFLALWSGKSQDVARQDLPGRQADHAQAVAQQATAVVAGGSMS